MPLTLLLTIGLAIVILAVAAGVTARVRRARPGFLGLGLTAMVVGLYLTGLTQLIADATLATIDWFQRTPWTTLTSWGVGLLAAGLILALIGAAIPKGTSRGRPGHPTGVGTPGARPPVAAPSAPAPRQNPQQAGLDPEDAEVEELLRKRGIM